MSERVVYLDNAATTPVDPAVAEAMAACLGPGGAHANPSSAHAPGRAALALVEAARAQVARRVGAAVGEIVFTSGATESNNLALRGGLRTNGKKGVHLVTTRIEHPSVLEPARSLAAAGVDVTYLDSDASGLIAPAAVAAALRDDTRLVSIMHVNNEVGVVQDIAEIAHVCRARGVPVHVDAAQSAGKLELALDDWGVDLCSLSAHKLHGPKGVGALFVRSGQTPQPVLQGGGQQGGLRPGTLATHQIVGMGLAYELADPVIEGPRLERLSVCLRDGLAALEGVRLNGSPQHSAPHIVSATFAGVEGESLRLALADLAVSQGSACASDVDDPSHVLSSLGLSDAAAHSTLRLSVGRFTSDEDVRYAVGRIADETARLRQWAVSAPAWCRSP